MHGCGQCMPCRVNRRRVWTHRILLEASLHPVNSFWTLTYRDEEIPLTKEGIPNLQRKDLTDFMKRLRVDYSPTKLRYFNVGEYGDQSGRPHYHLALFNYPGCARGVTRQIRSAACCGICDRVSRIWGKGIVHSGQLEAASVAYICGYVTKKLTADHKISHLQGREKEFAAMSLKPGIGAGFMDEVASTFLEHKLDTIQPDVPNSLAHSGRPMPLGPYLTKRLRKRVGMDEKAPMETHYKAQEKLRPMFEAAKIISPMEGQTQTFKRLVIEAHEGPFQRLVGKQSLTKKRGSI